MELYAVAGQPIFHSRSPEIFRQLFRRHNLSAAYSRIKAATPEEALGLMQIVGVRGLNVTAPLKERMLPHVSPLDESAERTGGINLVIKAGCQLLGGNVDPSGVMGALAARGINPRDQRVLVVGAGGAARAAVFGLKGAGAKVTIVNRTDSRAQALAEEFSCRSIPSKRIPESLSDCDLLLSTVPAGADMIKPEWLKPGVVVFDADYREGALLKTAAAAGCRTIAGEEWLVHQALYSFRWFVGRPADANAAALLPFAFRRRQKKNVACVGFMACGKTSIAKMLAERLRFNFFDSDAEIERSEGMTVAEIFQRKGEAYFRSREQEMVARLAGMKGVVFASGGGAVLAAENRVLLQTHAWNVWPVVGLAATRNRLQPGSRPLLNGAGGGERLETLFRERRELYFSVADLIVNGERRLPELCEDIHEEMRFSL